MRTFAGVPSSKHGTQVMMSVEVLVKLDEVSFEATFPLVASTVIRRRPLQILLAEGAILKGHDWCRLCVGFETIGIAAHHEAQIGQQALRKMCW